MANARDSKTLSQTFNANEIIDAGKGTTLLLRAIDEGKSRDIEALLRAGADPDKADSAGRTPMDAALWHGYYRIAETLLAAGAKPPAFKGDPNGPYPYEHRGVFNVTIDQEVKSQSALTWIIRNAGDYGSIFVVLANGADVNLRDPSGQTPMQAAIRREWPYAALQLAKRGAWINPDKPDPDEVIAPDMGTTRLLGMILEGQDGLAVKKALDDGADPDKADKCGLTPLAAARAMKWPYVEKLLLDRGANPDTQLPDANQLVGRNKDQPWLVYSRGHYHSNFTNALLEACANPDAADAKGMTAAHYAAIYGDRWLLQALEDAGADIFLPDRKMGYTPLHCAAMNGRVDIVDDILQVAPSGAIEQRTNDGKTALYLAAGRKGGGDLVKYLIDNGADINAADKDGATPLTHAAEKRNAEAVKLLLENGADVKGVNYGRYNGVLFGLSNCAGKEENETARLLIEAGADVNLKGTYSINGVHKGDSLFYYAVTYHADEIAKMLAKAGADVHGTSHIGQSAMHHCLSLRQSHAVKMLLDHGFDPLKEFDFTIHWSGGSGGDRDEHIKGNCLDYAKELVKKFGHGSEYGKSLDLIEEHLRKKDAAPAPKAKAPKKAPKAAS